MRRGGGRAQDVHGGRGVRGVRPTQVRGDVYVHRVSPPRSRSRFPGFSSMLLIYGVGIACEGEGVSVDTEVEAVRVRGGARREGGRIGLQVGGVSTAPAACGAGDGDVDEQLVAPSRCPTGSGAQTSSLANAAIYTHATVGTGLREFARTGSWRQQGVVFSHRVLAVHSDSRSGIHAGGVDLRMDVNPGTSGQRTRLKLLVGRCRWAARSCCGRGGMRPRVSRSGVHAQTLIREILVRGLATLGVAANGDAAWVLTRFYRGEPWTATVSSATRVEESRTVVHIQLLLGPGIPKREHAA
ncbi:hypothetical protein C8F04DRAFT_1229913 [Mycena alexandri]|uniref:Uncharacterized protein n=1 Tax=Mycena alexandri TaxID=1745969 RepID=A0AAD6XBQ4_9AGAR|nr:hypothetical protein C8F04DRAFT_1229913 [Mycena alexandri]